MHHRGHETSTKTIINTHALVTRAYHPSVLLIRQPEQRSWLMRAIKYPEPGPAWKIPRLKVTVATTISQRLALVYCL